MTSDIAITSCDLIILALPTVTAETLIPTGRRQKARAVGPSHTEGILFSRNTEKMELGLLLSFHEDWYSCCCSSRKSLPVCDLLFKILSFVILQFDVVWSEQMSASIIVSTTTTRLRCAPLIRSLMLAARPSIWRIRQTARITWTRN
jgi:hypothetical protein